MTPIRLGWLGALVALAMLAMLASCAGGREMPDADVRPECTAPSACLDPALPYCVDGHCVGCDRDLACPAEAPVCDPLSHACGACAAVADCARLADRPVCSAAGACVACEAATDCAAAAPRCDQAAGACAGCLLDDDCAGFPEALRCATSGACVGCRDATDCAAAQPVCDADAATCRTCVADAECASGLCDEPTGTCVAEAAVVYLAVGGGPGPCTRAAPCATLADGVAAVDETRGWILVGAGAYVGNTTISGGTMIITGPGATLVGTTGNRRVLAIADAADVTVADIRIIAAQGTGDGVGCTASTLRLRDVQIDGNGGSGLDVDGCTVTLAATALEDNGGHGLEAKASIVDAAGCRFAGNTLTGVTSVGGGLTVATSRILSNRGGGLAVVGPVTLVNSFVVGNGEDGGSTIGGVLIQRQEGATVLLAHDTITANAGDTPAPGVRCLSFASPPIFHDTIVHGNVVDDGEAQTAGCAWIYSLIGPGEVPPGEGNLTTAPLYVDLATADVHLQPTSPGIDAGDPDTAITIDIDGEPRPRGARADIGADEAGP